MVGSGHRNCLVSRSICGKLFLEKRRAGEKMSPTTGAYLLMFGILIAFLIFPGIPIFYEKWKKSHPAR